MTTSWVELRHAVSRGRRRTYLYYRRRTHATPLQRFCRYPLHAEIFSLDRCALLLSAVATAVLFSASSRSCFVFFFYSVATIMQEPLHLARWNFTWTCTSTTYRTLLNFKVILKVKVTQVLGCLLCCGYPRSLLNVKVIGQRSRSHMVFLFLCVCVCAWYTAATHGQLSKALRSCLFIRLFISFIHSLFRSLVHSFIPNFTDVCDTAAL